MRKINDCFFAGLAAGIIGGMAHLTYNAVLLLTGLQYKTFWQAMGGLFYSPELLLTWLAQVHGAIDAIGVSAVNGILLSFTLKFTGKDYLYVKSMVLSSASAYFLFLEVFPVTGLGKDSAIVPWISMFGFNIFNGLLVGYVLQRIYSFSEETKIETSPGSPEMARRFTLLPMPARKPNRIPAKNMEVKKPLLVTRLKWLFKKKS